MREKASFLFYFILFFSFPFLFLFFLNEIPFDCRWVVFYFYF
jgi:hypothetical protein